MPLWPPSPPWGLRCRYPFLRESFQVSVSGDLARLLFECMESYQLQSCVQLRCQFGCENYSSTGPISQLEIELLSRVAQTETRFLARGRRILLISRV